MKNNIIKNALRIKNNIQNSHKTIYDKETPSDTDFWLPDAELKYLISSELIGKSYVGQKARTRSKSINQDICRAMGYVVPNSFKKSRPRFLCQNFDKYGQKTQNLQIFNESISPDRRYCILLLNKADTIINIEIISGTNLQRFDTTGKITIKYQASLLKEYNQTSKLLSKTDTPEIIKHFGKFKRLSSFSTDEFPKEKELMSISDIYKKLITLEGQKIKQTGDSRSDGDILQKLIYKTLGYSVYKDNGQLPDLMNQLLEIKRHSSKTVDLGLYKPDSNDLLPIPAVNNYVPKISDLRYAIIYTTTDEIKNTTIQKIFLVTGTEFFNFFHLFGGNGKNVKLQISLPKSLWKN